MLIHKSIENIFQNERCGDYGLEAVRCTLISISKEEWENTNTLMYKTKNWPHWELNPGPMYF